MNLNLLFFDFKNRLKNNEDLKPDDRIKITQDDNKCTLNIENVVMNDSGSYTVLAQNKLGKVTSKCDLLVVYAPKIKSALKDSSVVVKKNISFDDYKNCVLNDIKCENKCD